ncbi:MAG: DUF420 domain-containing protein [Planctomycetia bacterium]|nr:DUF420 domain-containing protein [Planctomycetia bacterium]
MLTGPQVIFFLQTAVVAVTILLIVSLVALSRGQVKLHGRINLVFFVLTLTTVVGFEILIRFVEPQLFRYIHDNPALLSGLRTHLCFSVPALLLMPAMLYTGMRRRRETHLFLAGLFALAWLGTLITGLFWLPTE